MNCLQWVCVTDVSIGDIKKAEQAIGFLLPKEYVTCVLQNHGGVPNKEYYIRPDGRAGVFGQLLRLTKSDDYLDVVSIYHYLLEDGLIPTYIIPFADDPAGNFLCFDFRDRSAQPTIVFLDHELEYQEDTNAITFISNSFVEFLGSLYNDE